MKPDKGSEDMEEIVWDPVDLFVDIGLLITEARTPELSPKGRVEGPHCPSVHQPIAKHTCDKHREQCRKSEISKFCMLKLVKNNIPMRVDTLLMPNCSHGQLEASHIEGPVISSRDPGILLERWDVQILPKRMDKTNINYVTGRVLLQAIRSYLHFSQLSSWLISQKGLLPNQIVYRIYAPGESIVGHEFSSNSDLHYFPLCDLSHTVMRVIVSSIPRLGTIPVLLCEEEDVSPHWHKRVPVAEAGLTTVGDTIFQEPCVRAKVSKNDPSENSAAAKGFARRKSPDVFADDKLDDIAKCDKMLHRQMPPQTYNTQYENYLPMDKNDRKKSPDLYNKAQFEKNLSVERNIKKNLSDYLPFDKGTKRQYSPDLNKTEQFESYLAFEKRQTKQKSWEENLEDLLHCDMNTIKSAECKDAVPTPLHKTYIPKNTGAQKPPLSQHSSDGHKKDAKPQSMLSASVSCQTMDFSSLPPPGSRPRGQHYLGNTVNTLKESFKEHPLKLPKDNVSSQDNKLDPEILSKRLPSPKVLLTSSSSKGNTTFFKRKKIDLGKPGDSSEECSDILSNAFTDLMAPLKSEDLEAYFTSLSHRVPEKTDREMTLNNIPLTKCKFYIGDEDKSRKNKHPEEQRTDTPIKLAKVRDSEHSESLNNQASSKPVRNLFKKSLSEPGPRLQKVDISSPVDIAQNSGQSSVSSKSGAEDLSENGCSDDSTPTNSLSDVYDVSIATSTSSVTTITSSTLPLSSGLTSSHCHHRLSPQLQKSRDTTLSLTDISREVSNGHHVSQDDIAIERELHNLHISQTHRINSSLSSEAERNTEKSFSGIHDDDLQKKDGCQKNLKESALCKQLLTKELQKSLQKDATDNFYTQGKMPDAEEMIQFRKTLTRSTTLLFNSNTGLPTRSSPAPTKRKSTGRFDYDSTLINARAIKNALSCSKLALESESLSDDITDHDVKILSTSAPASTNCLLGNFEESMLNGRIEPVGVVEGFTCEIGAGGTFCPKHVNLPVAAYFFQLSDDNAPSPYLGHINLDTLGKRGYHIPKCGTLQVTLFNPNKTVVKMFVVMYDLSDMPPNSQTFLRQRTLYTPVDPNSTEPSFLRYLIHLRLASSKTGKIYLHTDVRLIFARDKFEFDPRVANYELRSFTEGPQNPKFSPKR